MKVKLCRSGLNPKSLKYPKINGEHKGAFEKEFASLSDLANYIASANGKVLIVDYKQLNKHQRFILAQKFGAIRNRINCSGYLYI